MAGNKGDNTVNEKMTAIANKIRSKTGKTEPLNLEEMASGVGEVYEEGKEKGRSDLWDAIQNYGNRTNYGSAFKNWQCEEIIPLYKVEPTNSAQMFAQSSIKRINKELFDLSKSTITSSTTSAGYALCDSCTNLEVFPDIGLQAGFYGYIFQRNTKLHTVEIMRSTEDCSYTSAFLSATALRNIRFEGLIGKAISFSSCPLTAESMKNIISCLKDYTGTDSEYRYTVTFKSTAFSALTNEGATSPNGNTWAEYIDDLKWNLTLA